MTTKDTSSQYRHACYRMRCYRDYIRMLVEDDDYESIIIQCKQAAQWQANAIGFASRD